MQPYAICTDSAADFPWLAAVSQKVEVAHLKYYINEQAFTYTPGREGNARLTELYAAMREGAAVHTEEVGVNEYAALLEPHMAAGRDVLLFCVSRHLSKSFLNARTAREELLTRYPNRRIVLVDTLSVSIAGGMLVNEAALMRQDGASLDEVVEWALVSRANINGLLYPGSMAWLKEGGYASGGGMGALLGRRPLLELDAGGTLQIVGYCRDEEDAITGFITHIQETGQALTQQVLAVTHSDAIELATRLREALVKELGCKDATILPMGAIAGCHVGPGAVGVSFFGYERE